MSAETPAVVRTFDVGGRRCTITAQVPQAGKVTNLVVEWSPSRPRWLSQVELWQYRQGRDAVMAELSHEIGGLSVAIEV